MIPAKPLCPCRRIWQFCACHGGWVSGEEEQFEFHVSTCAGAISPTSAGHSGWMQCLPHAAVFECGPGVVACPCLWCDSLRSNDACAASPPAAALEEATHTHLGRRYVLGQQRW